MSISISLDHLKKKGCENDNGGGETDEKKELTFLPRAVILCRQVFLSSSQYSCFKKPFLGLSSVHCMSLFLLSKVCAGSLQFSSFPPMLNFKKFLSLTVLRQNQHSTKPSAVQRIFFKLTMQINFHSLLKWFRIMEQIFSSK